MEAVVTNFGMQAAAAEIFLLTAICVILLVDVFLDDSKRWVTYGLTMLTLAGCAFVTVNYAVDGRVIAFDGMFIADPMGDVLKLFTYGTVAVSLLYSREYLQRNGLFRGEFFILALVAMLGVMVMVSAGSLLTVYLGVELLSLSLYAMVAFDRDSGVAAESAMKYFVLGAIASGALLYGFSILYGVAGTLQLDELAVAVREVGAGNLGLIFGLAFVIVGIAFKFGAVPFHMWVPDVYHGAPTPVTMFIGSAPKIASFILAIRVLAEGLDAMVASWQNMLIAISIASMIIGNVVAIAQTNLKRMLAYSTISHVGFILLGILAGTNDGYRASMFYTLTYVIMAVGSFGMILLLSRKGFEGDQLEDFKGLARKSPWFAAVMMMLMFSTAGVPPFVGFWAKIAVLGAVVNVGLSWLAAVAVLLSVVGAFYYLRVIKLMYFDEPTDTYNIEAGGTLRAVLSANGVAVLALGIFPSVLLDLCARVLP
ncbi:NADH-quinone oxidoreductase subunit N [Steroidobacter agaridevorans]|uniref:NADH-quinone oxidoreductase subunit N n=1 Tax=Steroidobacter agaridevorans TaxID=2695856 RepID=A0A829YQH0_9GAMM|nr:NADH-quinone oxidoreductase subunit NuoN [Steroidobacter agaridevorans]GFE84848.1 NADH-quinone oxidoreductase subunit N [Steroidobacter agaridevorans]GFE91871.1 NADH-quinone oxidoreductase subunit N [Steroidobacter agaridevorans]